MDYLLVSRFVAACAALGAVCVCAAPSWAGLTNQPQPSAEMTGRLQGAVRQFFIQGGDLSKARPDVLLLVEQNPTADYTETIGPALRDATLYNGLTDLLAEQIKGRKSDQADYLFLVYNLSRVHLLHARYQQTSGVRRTYLDAASKTAMLFPATLRDPGAWELKGDIEAERGDIEAASAAYNRVASSGGGRARAQYLLAGALQRGNRFVPAERTYGDAIQAAKSEDERELQHLAYQGLAGLYLRQGNNSAALDALARSARITPAEGRSFRYRLNVAQQLLEKGYSREVGAFTDAALRVSPDDADAKALKEQAAHTTPRR